MLFLWPEISFQIWPSWCCRGKVVFAASAQAVRVKVTVLLLLSLTLYRLTVTKEFIICLMCFNLLYPTWKYKLITFKLQLIFNKTFEGVVKRFKIFSKGRERSVALTVIRNSELLTAWLFMFQPPIHADERNSILMVIAVSQFDLF